MIQVFWVSQVYAIVMLASTRLPTNMSSQQPCSPLSRATEQRSSPAARHQCNETRAMSNDATRETEQKNLDLLGNHWQVARCKSVCAAGEGIRRRWRGGRDRKLSTRVARFVLRPQNKAAKSGVFSLEAERRGDERNKKKNNRNSRISTDAAAARTF